jgi:hypothetical protein
LLGFAVGGMAIVLSVASSSIFLRLSEKGKSDSFFMKMVVSYLHCISCQVITLILCLALQDVDHWFAKFPCAVCLCYCLFLAFSIGVQLFQMAGVYNADAALQAARKGRQSAVEP